MEFPCNLLSHVTQLKYKLLLIMTVMIELKSNTETPSVSFIMFQKLIAKEAERLYYTSLFNTSHAHVHGLTYIYDSTCSYKPNILCGLRHRTK
jgi:hypothetical protein